MSQEARDVRQELMALSKNDLVERLLALEEKRFGGYDDDKFEYICEQIMLGRTVRQVFRSDADEDKNNRPHRATFYRWLNDKEINKRFDVQRRYQTAMFVGTSDLNDEILEIADDGSNDWMEKHNSEGEMIGWMENGEAARRSKLRVEARERYIARMCPKKWGKLATEGETKNTTVKDRVIRLHNVTAEDVPDVNA